MDKKERERIYYQENKEKRKNYRKEYRNNLGKKTRNEYDRNWSKNNKLRKKYHSGLYKISGYTFEEFNTHLMNLGWKPGIHIDHKIPITHFTPDTPIRLINDLRNLQILSLKENTTKLNTYRDRVCNDYWEEVQKYLKII
jgi:hypothetical protein